MKVFRRLAVALATKTQHTDSAGIIRARYFDGPTLLEIPAKKSNRLLILEDLARKFEAGRDYPEKEVNRILNRVHEDHAALRRYLVDEGFLTRDSGVYRRAPS